MHTKTRWNTHNDIKISSALKSVTNRFFYSNEHRFFFSSAIYALGKRCVPGNYAVDIHTWIRIIIQMQLACDDATATFILLWCFFSLLLIFVFGIYNNVCARAASIWKLPFCSSLLLWLLFLSAVLFTWICDIILHRCILTLQQIEQFSMFGTYWAELRLGEKRMNDLFKWPRPASLMFSVYDTQIRTQYTLS